MHHYYSFLYYAVNDKNLFCLISIVPLNGNWTIHLDSSGFYVIRAHSYIKLNVMIDRTLRAQVNLVRRFRYEIWFLPN